MIVAIVARARGVVEAGGQHTPRSHQADTDVGGCGRGTRRVFRPTQTVWVFDSSHTLSLPVTP